MLQQPQETHVVTVLYHVLELLELKLRDRNG
jgi:hypothetical protein